MNPASDYGRAVTASAGLLREEAGPFGLAPEAAERLRDLIATVRDGIREGHLKLSDGPAAPWPAVAVFMSREDQVALSRLLGSIEQVEAIEPPSVVFAAQAALQRFEGDRALLGDVLEIFVQQVPLLLARMTHSFRTRDTGAVAGIAHELRGAAANVGADSLRAVAAQLERDVKEGRWEAASSAADALGGELERLQIEVEAFVDKGPRG